MGLIYRQETTLNKLDKIRIKGRYRVDSLKQQASQRAKTEKGACAAEIMSEVDETARESWKLIQEQGSGARAWLTEVYLTEGIPDTLAVESEHICVPIQQHTGECQNQFSRKRQSRSKRTPFQH